MATRKERDATFHRTNRHCHFYPDLMSDFSFCTIIGTHNFRLEKYNLSRVTSAQLLHRVISVQHLVVLVFMYLNFKTL